MIVSHPTFSGKPRDGSEWYIRSYRLFLAVLFLVGTTASAVAEGRKLAPDLATFPSYPDGSVDVIIQFRQTPQTRDFEALAAHGGHLKQQLHRIKGAAYRIPSGALSWLEQQPDVAYVSPDRPNQAAFDDAAPAVLGDLARQQYAVDGTGIGVAIIDSGVYNHDDLQLPFSATSRIVYSESFVPGDPSTNDAYGHGTHVAGIIAGNGQDSQTGYSEQYIGLAPNANIINLRVLDGNGAARDSQVISAIQRAIQLKNKYNIRVINLSLGRNVYESYTQDPLCQAVEAAWKAGIVVVVAAGNSGRDNSQGTKGYGTIQAPGNDPNVITVGATKTDGTPTRLDDTIASYSSRGPTAVDHVVKPDLVAPGNRIISLQAPGSYLATHYPALDIQGPGVCVLGVCSAGASGQYMRLSGTSMATPVVAGAAALMLQNDPTLTPDTIKARMMKTAWKGYPTSSWGYDLRGSGYLSQYDVFTIGAGYLDVDAALGTADLASGGAPSPIAVFNPVTGQARLTNSLSVVWGSSVVWGNSIVWADSIVWSPGLVGDSIIWGNSVVWGQTSLAGNSIIWSTSIVWSPDSLDAMSAGEDGEN
jgi:serine protease AprX